MGIIIGSTDELIRIRILHRLLVKNYEENKVATFADIQNYFEKINQERKKNGMKTISVSRATLFRDLNKLKKITENEITHKSDEWNEYPKGYYYETTYKDPFIDILPVTKEQYESIENLKSYAKKTKNQELEKDLLNLLEILDTITK